MSIAFYAPMKPPDHTVASGDRTIARGLMKALRMTGHDVALASTLQTRDGKGEPVVQQRLIEDAETEANRLIALGRRNEWRAWITYHNYYKAPDLIGPPVTRSLNIPYLQVESTRARKRLAGPWARFAQSAERAADAADVIFHFTENDAKALRDTPIKGQTLVHLHPFVDTKAMAYAYDGTGPILSVGMMRTRDKLASYQIIAETLGYLDDLPWRLQIAGDGPARQEVESLFTRFGKRVEMLGFCETDTLREAYCCASAFLWPGVNEAFGIAYLEAQAAGLPIVAQDRPGVREVLPPGDYPAPDAGPAALATLLREVLSDQAIRTQKSMLSFANFNSRHTVLAAAKTLNEGLSKVGIAP